MTQLRFLLLFLLLQAGLFSAGCAPTETGNPPATPPETGIVDDFVISTASGPTNCGDAEVSDGGICPGNTIQAISGFTSSVSENAEVWIFNLDTFSMPAVAPVSDQGKFTLSLSYVSESPIYRMQLRTDDPEAFYQPRNFVFRKEEEGSLDVLKNPHDDCLSYVHTVRWDAEARARIAVTNRCGESIAITDVRSWSGASDITNAPTTFMAGQRTTFELSGNSDREDLLIVETGDAPDEQLVINLVP